MGALVFEYCRQKMAKPSFFPSSTAVRVCGEQLTVKFLYQKRDEWDPWYGTF